MSSRTRNRTDQSPIRKRFIRVDEICDAFEAAWLAGDRPMIEHFLGDGEGCNREELLTELLLTERELGERSGKTFNVEVYQERFPKENELIQNLYDHWISRQNGPRSSMDQSRELNACDRKSGSGLSIRCPDCHCLIQPADDSTFSELTCPACGCQFSLTDGGAATQDATSLRTVGHFELVERIGIGAYGTVWKARDTQLDRTVAVKIPRKGELKSNEIEMFLREARTAAQLRHPNILTVHEVGRDGDTVYIVSDLVRGISLADWLTGQNMTAREAAELCAKLADALHHAHEAGVIHRDVKPQNIMLDDDRQPHLMDFGLARREAGEVTMTLDGHVLGTPEYMSPEQARGEAHVADCRTDIYSLGVILFRLLTRELPFRGNTRMLIYQVLHEEPPSPRRLNSSVPRDLETICLKCLEKEPARRFSSAADVSDEFQRYLQERPIKSRPISAPMRLFRWCKRNPVLSSTGAIAVLLACALAIGGYVAAWKQSRLTEEKRQQLYVSDLQSAADAFNAADLSRALELLDRHRNSDLKTIEWDLLWRKCQTGNSATNLFRALTTIDPDARATRQLQYSTKGDLAAAHFDGSVSVWRDNKLLHRLSGHPGYFAQAVAFSDEGELVASSGDDHQLRVWGVDSGELVSQADLGGAAWSLAFLDQDTIIAPTPVAICRYSVETGDPLGTISKQAFNIASEHGDVRFAITADKTLLARSNRLGITIENLATGEACQPWKAYEDAAWCLSFSDDGKLLLAGGGDQDPSVKVWDTATRKLLCTLRGHEKRVRAVRVSPTDSDLIASVGWDMKLKLWSLSLRKELATLVGHSAALYAMDFSPDGQTIATAGIDGAKLWDLEGVTKERLICHELQPTDVSFLPDGTLLTAGKDGVTLWDSDSGDLKTISYRVTTPPAQNVVTCSPDGRIYSTLADAWRVAVVEVGTQQVLLTLEPQHGSKLSCLAFSPSGSLLASGSWQGQITLWNAESDFIRLSSWDAHSQEGAELTTEDNFWGQPEMVHDIVFVDEETLVSIGADRALRVWNLSVGKRKTLVTEQQSFVPGPSYPRSMVLSDDGRLLAVADEYGSLSLYRTRPLKRLARWSSLSDGVLSISFAPRDTLITGGWDGDLKFWDVQSQSLRMTMDVTTPVRSIATYQGRIVWVGEDGVVRLWRTK